MTVLLPAYIDSDDVTICLQATLIEAYCYENDIHLLKVDNMDSLGHMLAMTSQNDLTSKNVKSLDLSCALIQYAEEENSNLSQNDRDLLDFARLNYEVFPMPIVTLPSD